MRTFIRTLITYISIFLPAMLAAGNYVWYDGNRPVTIAVDTPSDLVVGTAVEMFASDMQAVTGHPAENVKPSKAAIRLTQLDRATRRQRARLSALGVPVAQLDTLTDGFNISVADGQILITGSNGRGTAYGLLELSRKAGVSPWIWWGDVTPARRDTLFLPDNYSDTQGASVAFRGIFINDEDWSLRPWSSETFAPDETAIGPRTYREIFRLLMRLRANAVWPAMHPGTQAFFKNPANKLVADSCGIAVGSSHCEPLLRNNVDEWDESHRGRFNYITNKDAVQQYWIERLRDVKDSEGGNMFTIGMRGIHDGSMEGVNTRDEKFTALQQVIDDQQKLLAAHVGAPEKQMQVFVPYKEVLELYEMGLDVPDYVTLMWCDDNYGYITRLSTPDEQRRAGGAGVYYHLSYWGRPHDYLWLTTTQPGLLYNEMRNAYAHNVRRLWIANVHDPKAAAYDLELFLDLAWNIDCVKPDSLGNHLKQWLAGNFGEKAAEITYPVMREYYTLTAQRRPEFMGWSQTELDKRLYRRGLSPVTDTQFSFTRFGGEADRYMEHFIDIAAKVDSASQFVSPELRDAFFTAVIYPVKAAAANAVKILEAQRARSLTSGNTRPDNDPALLDAVTRSQNAYQEIRQLTEFYNDSIAAGKWRRSMSMRPRDLPFSWAPSLPLLLTDSEITARLDSMKTAAAHELDMENVIARNAATFDECTGSPVIIDLLGHSAAAVEIPQGCSLTYHFNLNAPMEAPMLTTALIPTQPDNGGTVRYSVSIDGAEPVVFDLKEPFRSEGWKLNVLRGQALRTIKLPDLAAGRHTLKITALDPHIVADQWIIDPDSSRPYYLIPGSV